MNSKNPVNDTYLKPKGMDAPGKDNSPRVFFIIWKCFHRVTEISPWCVALGWHSVGGVSWRNGVGWNQSRPIAGNEKYGAPLVRWEA